MAAKRVARKKVAAKSPAKRTARKKVTTREPKRIINRKKSTAKKRTAKAPVKKSASERKVERGANEAKQAEQVKKLVDGGMKIGEAAKKVGIAAGLAKRLFNKASVSTKDRIVGTEKEVGKKIAALRDKENVPWPVIRARTGMGPKQMRDLYEQTTGKHWRESGPAKSTKRGPAGKSATKSAGSRRKATSKRSAKAKTTTKAAARGRRSKAKAKAAKPTTQKSPAGETKREQRTRRIAENEKVLDALHDLDTDNDTIPEMLEGKTIVVTFDINGNKHKPREYTVTKVKDVSFSDREGRIVHYLDENKQNRVTSTREITAVK